MPFTIKDEIIDFAGIAKKHGLDAKLSNNVETHIVTVTIGGEIPSTLTNLIRYFATYAYPTRRMYPTSVDVINPDTKPLIEPVFIQISEMKFAHDCPLNEGNFLITHDKVFTEPLLVTAKYLKEAKYTNNHAITTLDKGCTFSFDYKIIEQTGIDDDRSCHYFASIFDRTNTEQITKTTKHKDSVPYDTGSFSFRYTDNITGQVAFDNITNLAKGLMDEILDNFDKYFLVNLAVPYLVVPRDRSGIVAACISRYVFEEYPGKFAITPHQLKNHTSCGYAGSTPDQVRNHIINAIKKIKADLS